MLNMRERMEREIVRNLLARKMYERMCEFKGWTPRGRTDNWAYDMADVAVDFLGFDPDMQEIEAMLAEVGP